MPRVYTLLGLIYFVLAASAHISNEDPVYVMGFFVSAILCISTASILSKIEKLDQ